MILIGMQVFVHRRLVVEHLDLHSHMGRIALQRGTDTDAIVCSGRQLKFESIDKIGKFVLGIQVTPAAKFRATSTTPSLTG